MLADDTDNTITNEMLEMLNRALNQRYRYFIQNKLNDFKQITHIHNNKIEHICFWGG